MFRIVFYMILGELSLIRSLSPFDVLAYIIHCRYTSLGGIENTRPNPALANPAQQCGYDPAHKLKDGNKERDGRIKRS